MNIINKNNLQPCIFHFCGNSIFNCEQILRDVQFKDFVKPDNITILTIFTNRAKSVLINQLDHNNTGYVNAFTDEHCGVFLHNTKMQYYKNALSNINTEYVLIVDAYDTLINSLDDLVDRFKTLNCDIVFNSCAVRFPNVDIEQEGTGLYKYINSGICFGKTNKVLEFYSECCNKCDSLSQNDSYKSEQYVFRNVINEGKFNVSVDYDCYMFACLAGMLFKQSGKNTLILYDNKKCKLNVNCMYNPKFPEWIDSTNLKFIEDGQTVSKYYIYNLTRLLEDKKPKTLLNLGQGTVASIFQQYNNKFGGSQLTVHTSELETSLFENNASFDNCIYAKYGTLNHECCYEDVQYPNDIDFISVDSPIRLDEDVIRVDILNLVKNKQLKEGCVILINDYQRKSEFKLVEKLKEYIDFDFQFGDCVYPFAQITNIKYKK